MDKETHEFRMRMMSKVFCLGMLLTPIGVVFGGIAQQIVRAHHWQHDIPTIFPILPMAFFMLGLLSAFFAIISLLADRQRMRKKREGAAPLALY